MDEKGIVKISLELSANRVSKTPAYVLAPYLQGALMEVLPGKTAEALHSTPINPYAQNLSSLPDGKSLWTVVFGTDMEADFLPALTGLKSIELRATGDVFESVSTKIERVSKEHFGELFYAEGLPTKHAIRFISPTAFKSHGRYIAMPNARLILQSLAVKYGVLMDGEDELPEGFADTLGDAANITSFNIKSRYMPIERVKIPAFMGELTISVKGSDNLNSYAHALFAFGELFGVGVKTSMGMGAMERKPDKEV